MKIFTRLFGLALLCAAMAAQAESWSDIHSTSSGFLQLDRDSVVNYGDGIFQARWRTGISLKQPYFIEQGTVDCKLESLLLSTSRFIQTDPVVVKLGIEGAITDYVEGKRRSGRYTTDLSDSDSLGRFRFPTPASAEGQLIREVCQQHYFPKAKREAFASSFQERLGCHSKPKVDSPLCANDSDTLETLYSLAFRLTQIKEACSVSQEQLDSVANNWLAKSFRCSDCEPSSIQLKLSSLGDDLARAANHQNCSYFPIAIEEAAKDKAKEEAIANFRTCIKRTIPAIDDRISSAETVASAAFAVCRSELTPHLANSKIFADSALPGLSELVLQYRQIAGQKPTKPAPKRKALQS